MQGTVLAVLAAGSVMLLAMGLALGRGPSVVKARLSQYAQRPRTLEELELEAPFSDRVLRPVASRLAALISRVMPQTNIETLRRNLILAGNPNNLQANDMLGIKGAAALVLGGGSVVMVTASKVAPSTAVLVVVALAAMGFILPDFWLGSQVSRRKVLITKALPDALDLLTVGVEAGLGFDAALNKVVEKWDNPLTAEFARVLAEMRVGKPRRDALRDMVTRTQVDDVTAFIAAIVQADQLGVSISRVLQIQSEQMRMRRRQRAEEKAHQAPIKMTIPLVFLIFPALMIVILGPAVPRIISALGGL
jgi:tight adherence protein C